MHCAQRIILRTSIAGVRALRERSLHPRERGVVAERLPSRIGDTRTVTKAESSEKEVSRQEAKGARVLILWLRHLIAQLGYLVLRCREGNEHVRVRSHTL